MSEQSRDSCGLPRNEVPNLSLKTASVSAEADYGSMHGSRLESESTALINHEEQPRYNHAEPPIWPRARELGWLFSNGTRYPPPTLPPKLRGLQGDLDSAWTELEHQHITANRYNLISTCLALLITTSGAITTAMAHSVHSASASLVLGTTTTIAGTIITGLRATGQPKRAHDRCKRLDKIIDHITRLYYEFGQTGPTHPGLNGSGAVDENGVIERAIEATWKMIDDEEAQAELEERKFVPFGYSTGGMIPSPVDIGGSEISRGLSGNHKVKLLNSSPTRRNLLEQGRGGRPLLKDLRSERNST